MTNASSPRRVLLQYADNPVDWRECGEEAFAEARRRDVPVPVSIGYGALLLVPQKSRGAIVDGLLATRRNESCCLEAGADH